MAIFRVIRQTMATNDVAFLRYIWCRRKYL